MNRPRIIPWIELAADANAIDQCIEGLRTWRAITDMAIVSIDPANVSAISTIRAKLRNIKLIPGLKTSPILKPAGFDNPQAWSNVASAAEQLRIASGSKYLLFEHESALSGYVSGESQIDMRQLAEGLKLLTRRLTYLWFPSAAGTDDLLNRYLSLARIVQTTLSDRVIFVDHVSLQAPQFVWMPSTLYATAALREIASEMPWPQIMVQPDTHWPFEWILRALARADSETVILYPGTKYWIDAAQDLSRRLP